MGISGSGGLEVGYAYDGANNRVEKTVNGVRTTYRVDPFSPVDNVPQVLVEEAGDEAVRYLYGLDLLGEVRAGSPTYYGYDALSIRLGLGEGGVLTARYRYAPFGEVVGEGPAGYGFTGERWDGEVGLLYLRARYYRPAVGRFVSRDPLQGELARPATLHRFIYVVNNPVMNADPSGLVANPGQESRIINPRDLTDWLYREMVNNANDLQIRAIRNLNEYARALKKLGPCKVWAINPSPGIGAPAASPETYETEAAAWFALLVRNGAKWDFKDEIGIRLGPGITLCAADACYHDIEYSVPGNIYYGYIGSAAGFAGYIIQYGAGWAEMNDPAHDPSSREYVGPYQGEYKAEPWYNPNLWNLGDEPQDHEAVSFGIILWWKYKDTMTKAQFKKELAGHIDRFARHAPQRQAVDPDVARYWPYPVGYFNNRGNVYKPQQEERP